MSSFLKPRSAGGGGGDVGRFRVEAEGNADFPNLAAFLSASAFEDGSRREPGTMLVFVEGGRLKVCLNDRGRGLVAFLTLSTLGHVMAQVEMVLEGDELDWRAVRGGKGK